MRGDTFISADLGLAKSNRTRGIALGVLSLCLLGVCFWALLVGPSTLTVGESLQGLFGQGDPIAVRIVQQIRVPRILAGLLAGASLSLAGLLMQTNLGNIMASPSTLGVTNAAVFGANLSILVLSGGMMATGNNPNAIAESMNPYLASGMALVFSVISVLLVLGLSTFRRFSPSVVVLAGIAIGAVWTGLTTFLQFFATDVGLSAAVVWSFGDLGRATYADCLIMGIALSLCSAFFFVFSWRYNAMLGGDGYARSVGVNVSTLRFISLLLASLLTAVSVSRIGLIGFIGIICPHAMRRILGSNHRFLIPASILSGSLLLLFSDTVARAFAGGASVPVGAVTSIIGAPFFLYLIFAKKETPNA
ncbi:MAG: iron ABC transporter permease [Bacilli bacterium]|nr:iron ABC transporter permease [Bacilli bacterium]